MEPPRELPQYAGFWSRAAARVIDVAVILAVLNVVYLLDRLGAGAGLWAGIETGDAGVGFSAVNVLRGAFFLFFPAFYYVYLHGAYGQTFGKMALRIKVVNEDGTPLDYRKSFLRWLGYFLCDLTFYIGYLWAAFDHRKQGLHDKLCSTLVVRIDQPPHVPQQEVMRAVDHADPVPPHPPPALDTSPNPPI
jgi:uncharacterized RDD family membrane protein YckC